MLQLRPRIEKETQGMRLYVLVDGRGHVGTGPGGALRKPDIESSQSGPGGNHWRPCTLVGYRPEQQ
jgi:hypothetical protein